LTDSSISLILACGSGLYGRHGKRMDQKSEMITEKARFCLNMEEAPGWQQPLLVDRGLDWTGEC
jgi:hypothetical protein